MKKTTSGVFEVFPKWQELRIFPEKGEKKGKITVRLCGEKRGDTVTLPVIPPG
jgi:hypothetical protein